MCVIIEKKAEHRLSDAEIRQFSARNKDGWGIMFLGDDGLPVAMRGLTMEAFALAYENVAEKECFIHFRLKTHGEISEENCHPYKVTDDVYLMHNGVIRIDQNTDKNLSDSWHFATLILKPLLEGAKDPAQMLRSPAVKFLIEELLGTGNRVVVLDKNGPVLFNEKAWHIIVEKKMRVSNNTSWTSHTPIPYANHGGYREPPKSGVKEWCPELVAYVIYRTWKETNEDPDITNPKIGYYTEDGKTWLGFNWYDLKKKESTPDDKKSGSQNSTGFSNANKTGPEDTAPRDKVTVLPQTAVLALSNIPRNIWNMLEEIPTGSDKFGISTKNIVELRQIIAGAQELLEMMPAESHPHILRESWRHWYDCFAFFGDNSGCRLLAGNFPEMASFIFERITGELLVPKLWLSVPALKGQMLFQAMMRYIASDEQEVLNFFDDVQKDHLHHASQQGPHEQLDDEANEAYYERYGKLF